MFQDNYHIQPAIAFIRSQLPDEAAKISDGHSFQDLNDNQIEQLIQLGRDKGLKLHRFKKAMRLPRVLKVIGDLHAFYP